MGLDPDSTYLIMSVWPIKNPHMALVLGGIWLLDYEQKYIKTIQRQGGRSEAMWSQMGISTPRYFILENYYFCQNRYLK